MSPAGGLSPTSDLWLTASGYPMSVRLHLCICIFSMLVSLDTGRVGIQQNIFNPLWCVCVCVFVVELQNAQILSKAGGENEERWRPWTSRYPTLAYVILDE